MKTFKAVACKKCGKVEINPSGFFVRCDDCGVRMKTVFCHIYSEGNEWYLRLFWAVSSIIRGVVKGFLCPFRYIRFKLYVMALRFGLKHNVFEIVY